MRNLFFLLLVAAVAPVASAKDYDLGDVVVVINDVDLKVRRNGRVHRTDKVFPVSRCAWERSTGVGFGLVTAFPAGSKTLTSFRWTMRLTISPTASIAARPTRDGATPAPLLG